MMNGQVAVFSAPCAELEIREYPLPEVGPEDMLVKIRRANICGSDLHEAFVQPGPVVIDCPVDYAENLALTEKPRTVSACGKPQPGQTPSVLNVAA